METCFCYRNINPMRFDDFWPVDMLGHICFASRGSKVSPFVASKTKQINIQNHPIALAFVLSDASKRLWLGDVVRPLLPFRVFYAHVGSRCRSSMVSKGDMVRTPPFGSMAGTHSCLISVIKVGGCHLLALHFPAPNVHRGGQGG